MTTPVWTPTQARIDNSNMTRYLAFLRTEYGLKFAHYQQLHQWSISNTALFWGSLVTFFQLKGDFNLSQVFVENACFYQSQWFPQSRLNFAQNLLNPSAVSHSFNPAIAIIARGEDGRRAELSYVQLTHEVTRVAAAMREMGVVKGDRVAGFLPNCSEAVIAMLATTSIGAIWSSCSPDFGHQGVQDRFGQIQPKLLFATNGYQYAGKQINTLANVHALVASLTSLQLVVMVEYLSDVTVLSSETEAESINKTETSTKAITKNIAKIKRWQHFKPAIPRTLVFEQVNFADPLYIMYSSGTTGVPKCIVHSVGGTLLQHAKELALHTDVKARDRIFYYTTCGWMMWNWLVSSLSQGATLMLFDGSPFYPTQEVLFELAASEQVSIFGGSAKYFSACDKAGLQPNKNHDLSALKTLLSTGSPLAHEIFDYIYQHIKKDVCVSSICGGTDIISCFMLGIPTLPVYRGELQCLGLGMDVAFYDKQGQALSRGKGELVCRRPFPSMPIGFWQDEDNKKYHNAYFSRFDNVWAHGDYGELVPHISASYATDISDITESPHDIQVEQLGVIIHGRADAVLNPGGVRIGTSEIYRQVDKLTAVQESIAIGQQWDNDVRVVLFVQLSQGLALDDKLKGEIKAVIRSNTSPRHVPAVIVQVADSPRTISGKIVELAVRNVVHGLPVTNKDALANPEALALFANLAELQP
jgi:acetoacetyl-CoA synthetase